MTSDPRAALAAALTEGGPTASLLALRYAAEWAARTVLDEVRADDVAALECVIALDDALPSVGELMGQVPELVMLASAGSSVGNKLIASAAKLKRQRDALTAERAALESVRDLSARLAEVEAERERLRGEIERAERTARIERELPALRQTLAELTAAVSAADGGAASADAVLQGLIAAGRRLAGLTEEQRLILDLDNEKVAAKVVDVTAVVEQALARRGELAAELETRDREADELRAAEEKTLPGLRARRQADAELVAALLTVESAGQQAAPLSALERIQAEFAELEQRVDSVEGRLTPLLRQHQRAYEEARQIRGLLG